MDKFATVKWFDEERGFGFLLTDEGDELWFHMFDRDRSGLSHEPREGDRVAYAFGHDAQGRPKAARWIYTGLILNGLAKLCRREFPFGYGWRNDGEIVPDEISIEDALEAVSTHRRNRRLDINRERVQTALDAGCEVHVLRACQADGFSMLGDWTIYHAHGIFVIPDGGESWYTLGLASEITAAGAFEYGCTKVEAFVEDPVEGQALRFSFLL